MPVPGSLDLVLNTSCPLTDAAWNYRRLSSTRSPWAMALSVLQSQVSRRCVASKAILHQKHRMQYNTRSYEVHGYSMITKDGLDCNQVMPTINIASEYDMLLAAKGKETFAKSYRTWLGVRG